VKSKLCNLTHVFVITDTSYSPRVPLGIWEAPVRGKGMYIAIPYELLDSTLGGPSSLADEENALLYGRLLNVNPVRSTLPSFAEIPPSNTHTPEAAMLAVVDHELGHILLADTNADGAGPPGHTRPCSLPNNSGPVPRKSCFGVDFLAAAGGRGWQQGLFNPRRWVSFGTGNGNKHNIASIKTIDDLRAEAAIHANDAATTADINEIYNKGFVSVFAAVSPEEDFVETYKYGVLADAGLTNLGIKISGTSTISVLGRTSTELDRKNRCVIRVTQ